MEVVDILNALNPLRPGRTWIVFHPRRQHSLTLSPVLKTHVCSDLLAKRISTFVGLSPCWNRNPFSSIRASERYFLSAVRIIRCRATREAEEWSAE